MPTITLKGDHSIYTFTPDDQSTILGKGGMGVVFKGKDKNTSKDVAIKVIFREISESIDNVERARREASIKISHKNLIQNLDFVELNGVYHIVSEYVDGENLREHLNTQPNKKLNTEKAIAIISEVLDALTVLHKQGIVHRDIDPSNIMICRNGAIKLTDFGIAKNQNLQGGTLTGTNMFIGKLQYASPEQIRGNKNDIDAKSDLYSLGIVFYELVAGQRPFNAINEYDLMRMHIETPLPKHNEIPDYLFDIIQKITSKEKAKRYANAESLKKELTENAGSKQPLTSAKAYFDRAEKKREKKEFEAAIIDYNNALINGQYYPLNPDYYFNRAWCKSELGDLDGAIEDYTKVIEHNAENDAAYNNRGVCYKNLSLKLACNDFFKAYEISQDELYYNNWINYFSENSNDTSTLDKYLEHDWPNKDIVYFQRGKILINIGEREKGTADIKKAKELGCHEAKMWLKDKRKGLFWDFAHTLSNLIILFELIICSIYFYLVFENIPVTDFGSIIKNGVLVSPIFILFVVPMGHLTLKNFLLEDTFEPTSFQKVNYFVSSVEIILICILAGIGLSTLHNDNSVFIVYLFFLGLIITFIVAIDKIRSA